MKVKYIKDGGFEDLTLGKIYNTLENNNSLIYLIKDDEGVNRYLLKEYFKIVEEFVEGEKVKGGNTKDNLKDYIYIKENQYGNYLCIPFEWEFEYKAGGQCRLDTVRYVEKIIPKEEKKFKLGDKVRVKQVNGEFIITGIVDWHYLINGNLEHGDNIELIGE